MFVSLCESKFGALYLLNELLSSTDPGMACITQRTYVNCFLGLAFPELHIQQLVHWMWQVRLDLKCKNFIKNLTLLSLLTYLENDSVFRYNIQAPILLFMTSLNLPVLCAFSEWMRPINHQEMISRLQSCQALPNYQWMTKYIL